MAFNDIIHQPVRLQIMSSLAALPESTATDFPTLRDALVVTDGNIGAHLRRLSDAGYVEITKSFVDEKPRTRIVATASGRRAFLEHVIALQEIIRDPVDVSSRF